MTTTKQLLFIDTPNTSRNAGTFERFHAEGIDMLTDAGIQVSESEAHGVVLDVYGHVLANKVRARSDERLKKDVQNIQSGLDTVKQLCGKMYTMKGERETSYGLIAQEVERVIPSIVHTEDDTDGYKNVSYIELIPFLIESIKELDSKLEQLLKSFA